MFFVNSKNLPKARITLVLVLLGRTSMISRPRGSFLPTPGGYLLTHPNKNVSVKIHVSGVHEINIIRIRRESNSLQSELDTLRSSLKSVCPRFMPSSVMSSSMNDTVFITIEKYFHVFHE